MSSVEPCGLVFATVSVNEDEQMSPAATPIQLKMCSSSLADVVKCQGCHADCEEVACLSKRVRLFILPAIDELSDMCKACADRVDVSHFDRFEETVMTLMRQASIVKASFLPGSNGEDVYPTRLLQYGVCSSLEWASVTASRVVTDYLRVGSTIALDAMESKMASTDIMKGVRLMIRGIYFLTALIPFLVASKDNGGRDEPDLCKRAEAVALWLNSVIQMQEKDEVVDPFAAVGLEFLKSHHHNKKNGGVLGLCDGTCHEKEDEDERSDSGRDWELSSLMKVSSVGEGCFEARIICNRVRRFVSPSIDRVCNIMDKTSLWTASGGMDVESFDLEIGVVTRQLSIILHNIVVFGLDIPKTETEDYFKNDIPLSLAWAFTTATRVITGYIRPGLALLVDGLNARRHSSIVKAASMVEAGVDLLQSVREGMIHRVGKKTRKLQLVKEDAVSFHDWLQSTVASHQV